MSRSHGGARLGAGRKSGGFAKELRLRLTEDQWASLRELSGLLEQNQSASLRVAIKHTLRDVRHSKETGETAINPADL